MKHAFIDGLSTRGDAVLRGALRQVSARRGERIIRRGDRAAGVYLVRSGVLRVVHEDDEGRQRTLYRLAPGDACVLALNCSFTGMRYPADVDVEQAAKVWVVDGPVWKELFETEPSARDFTVQQLGSWVFDLLGLLDAAVADDLPTRLADELLERMGADGRVLTTHAELATHLGTAREVVSRTLGGWRKVGAIRTGRGWIEVVDGDALVSR